MLGVPIGAPKTGVFGLLDMVGLDLMPHVLASLSAALPKDDAFHAVNREPALIKDDDRRWPYRAQRQGRLLPPGAGPARARPSTSPAAPIARCASRSLQSLAASRRGRIARAPLTSDKGGRYAWWVMSRLLAYAAELVPEIADDIAAVDSAMRLGYNWKYGPFELIDRIGAGLVRRTPCAPRAWPCRRCWRQAEGRSFYRTGQRPAAIPGGDGRLPRRGAPAGRAAPRRHQAARAARWREPLRQPVGYRRRRAVPRVPQQDEHPRPVHPAADRQGASSWSPAAIAAWSSTMRARIFRSAPISASLLIAMKASRLVRGRRSCSAMARRCSCASSTRRFRWWRRPAAWRWAAAARCCSIAAPCRPTPKPMRAWSKPAWPCPGWGGCKELLLRTAPSKAPPFGPMPPVIKAFETIATASVAKSAAQAKDLMLPARRATASP